MEESICIPGLFTGLFSLQLITDGALSMRRKGCFFMLRIMLWLKAALTAAGTSSFSLCQNG